VSVAPIVSGAVPRLTPSAALSTEAAERFREVVAAADASHFHETERGVLEGYAEAWALHRRAQAHLATEGAVLESGKTSPWFAIAKDAAFTMGTLATKLRLTPQARLDRKQVKPANNGPSLERAAHLARRINGNADDRDV
jgi:phage terminase small subunit